ncbi:MAG: DUF4199 domain-containing protein [Bacteroidetes bacterium]|nr:DUF4199 domain-containing protein [Bacteroidota bacterium]
MNKRALNFGLLYSLTVIVFKLIILLGGFTLTKFGFYYSNIVSVFLILPFFYLAIHQVRDKDYEGAISGREAMRMALTVLAVGIVVLGVYHYIEFNWKFKEIAVQYYNSNDYLEVLQRMQSQLPDKINTEDFPKIIEEQIQDLSAFKASTGKLLPLLIIGLSGAFITSALMKKR